MVDDCFWWTPCDFCIEIGLCGNRWLLQSATIYFVALAYSETWNLDIGNALVAAFNLGRVMCELCTFKVILGRDLVTCQQEYSCWVSLSHSVGLLAHPFALTAVQPLVLFKCLALVLLFAGLGVLYN